jgi:ketosteroid isomerase-like protein
MENTPMASIVNFRNSIVFLLLIAFNTAIASTSNNESSVSNLDKISNKIIEGTEDKKLFNLSLEFIEKKDWENAEKVLIKLLSLRSYDPTVFNNLAWVYFNQNKFHKGREVLMLAMQTSNVYKSVYENIGNVFQYESGHTYNKILGEDSSSTLPQIKIFNKLGSSALISSNYYDYKTTYSSAFKEFSKINISKEGKKPSKIVNSGIVAKDKKTDSVLKTTSATVVVKKDEVTEITAKPVEKDAKIEDVKNELKEVKDTLRSWASAWSKGDVESYLGFYANSFKPAKGKSLKTWKKQRKQRIYPKRKIKIKYTNVVITFNEEMTKADMSFSQKYSAGKYNSTNKKKITWIKNRDSDEWKIYREFSY